MHVTIPCKALKLLVSAFGKVIPRSPHLPVLGHLLFERHGEDRAAVTGTDLEQTLVGILDGAGCEAGEPDAFLFPLAELRKAAKSVKGSEALILHAEQPHTVTVTTTVNGQPVRSAVPAIDIDEFPQTWKAVDTAAYPVGVLAAAIRTALPFASKDETRHVLNGVFLHREEQSVVATDGRHLTKLHVPEWPFDSDLIIPPAKVFANGVFSNEDGRIGVLTEDDRVTFEINSGMWRYQTKCVDGLYPDYRQVIPPERTKWAGTLIVAVEDIPVIRAAVQGFAKDSNNGIRIVADSTRVVLLDAAVQENGDRGLAVLEHSQCECEAPLVSSVNGDFLVQALAAGFTECRIPTDISPWRCTGSAEGLHVVMPLHIQEDEKQALAAYVDEHVTVAVPKTEDNTVSSTGETGRKDATGATAPDAKTGQPGASRNAGRKNGGSKNKAPTFRVVETNPLEELLTGIDEARDLAQQASTAVRSLKAKARALERHYRARDREFESTGKLIAKLQEAVGF